MPSYFENQRALQSDIIALNIIKDRFASQQGKEIIQEIEEQLWDSIKEIICNSTNSAENIPSRQTALNTLFEQYAKAEYLDLAPEYPRYMMYAREKPKLNNIDCNREAIYLYRDPNYQNWIFAFVVHKQKPNETVRIPQQYNNIDLIQGLEWPEKDSQRIPFAKGAHRDLIRFITSKCKDLPEQKQENLFDNSHQQFTTFLNLVSLAKKKAICYEALAFATTIGFVVLMAGNTIMSNPAIVIPANANRLMQHTIWTIWTILWIISI